MDNKLGLVAITIVALFLAFPCWGLVTALIDSRPEDWPRTMTVWNLKQLALAMHTYHAQDGRLPPAAVSGADGKPLLSWRVVLLPYIEQNDLFQQFKMDEPWDSPHNIKLLDQMPSTYLPVDGIPAHEPFTTFYQVFVGKGTPFEGRDGLTFKDLGARVSNTFMIVEAANAVPWTKPEDIPYDESRPLPKLGGLRRGIFFATLLDPLRAPCLWILRKEHCEAPLFAMERAHRVIGEERAVESEEANASPSIDLRQRCLEGHASWVAGFRLRSSHSLSPCPATCPRSGYPDG